MTATFPASRILAAGSALAGLAIVMAEPSPSATGILAGLSSLALWAAFASVPHAKKQAIRITARKRPPSETADAPKASSAQTPRAAPKATPKATPMRSSKLSSVPTHRQRISDRRTDR